MKVTIKELPASWRDQYDYICVTNLEGKSWVEKDGKWGIVDSSNGTVLVPIEYDSMGKSQEGKAWVSKGKKKFEISFN